MKTIRNQHGTRPRGLFLPGLLTLLCLLQNGLAWAEPPAPASSPWNVRTAPPAAPKEPAGTETDMQLRLYEGFDGRGRGPASRTTPMAMDTGIRMVTCADGNREVRSMNMGGMRYEAQSDCMTTSDQGSVRVQDNQKRRVIGSAGPADSRKETAPSRCNPGTWNCTDPASAPAPASR